MRFKYLIFFFLLSCFKLSILNAQNYSNEELKIIDSLQSILNKKNIDDTSFIRTQINYGEFTLVFRKTYWDSICVNAEKLASVNKKKKDVFEKLLLFSAKSKNNIAVISQYEGNVPQSIDYFLKSLKLAEQIKNQNLISSICNNLGVIYQYQNKSDQSLKYLEKSLAIRLKINDPIGIGESYANVGVNYDYKADYLLKIKTEYDDIYKLRIKALTYYQKALLSHKKANYKKGIAVALNNIGSVYKNLALEIRQSGKDIDSIELYLQMALDYTNQSYLLRLETNDQSGLAYSLINLGSIHYYLKNNLEAKIFADKGYQLGVKLGFPELIRDAAKLLSDIEKSNMNFREALHYNELFIRMKDSLLNVDNQKNLVEKEMQFNFDKKHSLDSIKYEEEKKITDLKLEAQKTETKNEKIKSYYLYGVIFLILIFTIITINRFNIIRKQRNQIQEQKIEVEQQKNLSEEQRIIVEEKNNEILDSIKYAQRIQSAILPSHKMINHLINDNFILFKPKDIVAGDFYWLEKINLQNKNLILLAACDCTGHGVPGAMVSVICHNALNRAAREFNLTEPGEILTKTREIVIEQFMKSEEEVKDGMDISLCLIDFTSLILRWAGANNPLWILRNGTNEIVEVKGDKQPVGKHINPKDFTSHELKVNKNDLLYLFTDGYADQFGGPKGKKFKYKTLQDLLISIRNEPMEKQQILLDTYFEEWRGDLEQVDDVCIIGVRI